MRKLTNREKSLLGVLGLVALLIWYLSRGGEARLAGVPAPGGGKAAAAAGVAPVVETALLAQLATNYNPKGRNLFTYAKRPLTPEELEEQRRLERERQEALRLRREAAERRREAQKEAQTVQARKAPPPRPGPPKPLISYLGYLGPKDDRIAVFEDGKELLLARAGEVVLEQFVVEEINYEQVVIGYTKDEFKSQTTTLSMVKARR